MRSELYQDYGHSVGFRERGSVRVSCRVESGGAPAMHLTGAEVLAPLEQPFHDCLDPRHLRSRGLGPWRA